MRSRLIRILDLVVHHPADHILGSSLEGIALHLVALEEHERIRTVRRQPRDRGRHRLQRHEDQRRS